MYIIYNIVFYTQVYYFIYAFRTKSVLTSGEHTNRQQSTAAVFNARLDTHILLLFNIIYYVRHCAVLCSLNVIQGDRRKKNIFFIFESFKKFFRKQYITITSVYQLPIYFKVRIIIEKKNSVQTSQCPSDSAFCSRRIKRMSIVHVICRCHFVAYFNRFTYRNTCLNYPEKR